MRKKLAGLAVSAGLVGSLIAVAPPAVAATDEATYTVVIPIPGTPCKYTITAYADPAKYPPAYANAYLTCTG